MLCGLCPWPHSIPLLDRHNCLGLAAEADLTAPDFLHISYAQESSEMDMLLRKNRPAELTGKGAKVKGAYLLGKFPFPFGPLGVEGGWKE